ANFAPPHGRVCEGPGPGRAGVRLRDALARGIEETLRPHTITSRVTGWLPAGPFFHPPMMAEKSPAVPPACTISRFSGRNLGVALAANCSGMPSAQPPAPQT